MMQEQKHKQESLCEVDKLIELEEKKLDTVFSRIKNQMMSEFLTIKQNAIILKQNTQSNETTLENLLSITLPFSDKSRRIREKLNNTLIYKQIIMNTQNQLSKEAQLTKQQQKEAKLNFDLICNYKKRQNNNQSGKALYTVDVCKHLVRKTFKKTAHEVYETLASTDLKLQTNNQEQIRIVCIGGGPGSDLCGIIAHLLEFGVRRIQARVYDYNYQKWESVSHNLSKLLASQAKKFQIELNLNIQWRFIDMTVHNSNQLQQIIHFKPTIVSCCWALNEDLFIKTLWSNLIKNCSQTYFIFLDGNRYPLETILQFQDNRRVDYSGFESPRSLVLYPSSI